jgi:hypothetical protein
MLAQYDVLPFNQPAGLKWILLMPDQGASIEISQVYWLRLQL